MSKAASIMSARLAAQIDLALAQFDSDPDEVKYLSTGYNLLRLLSIPRGDGIITPHHAINRIRRINKPDISVMSSRQSAELDFALARNYATPELAQRLLIGDNLRQLLAVVRGYAKIRPLPGVIDCDKFSFDPADFPEHLDSHMEPDGGQYSPGNEVKGGLVRWDPKRIELMDMKFRWIVPPSSVAKGYGENVSIQEMNEEISTQKNRRILNWNVGKYLWTHKKEIPESWKQYRVLFTGSFVREPWTSNEFVQGLEWRKEVNEWFLTYRYNFGRQDDYTNFRIAVYNVV